MTEKQIENQILHFLNLQPKTFAWKNNSVGIFDPVNKNFRKKGRFNINGVSDILGVTDRQFFVIEVKDPKRKMNVSDEQKAFLRKISGLGHQAAVVCSLDEAVIFYGGIRDGSFVGRNENRWK